MMNSNLEQIQERQRVRARIIAGVAFLALLLLRCVIEQLCGGRESEPAALRCVIKSSEGKERCCTRKP